MKRLPELLERAASQRPEHVAVVDGAESITYTALAARAHELAETLRGVGVAPGDRVGVMLAKSIDSVAAQFAVMEAGAAYVPVDAHGPIDRGAGIFDDCEVRAIFVASQQADALLDELEGDYAAAVGVGEELTLLVSEGGQTTTERPEELAFLLYTSGSTGKPKGVMISHANALSFIEWCAERFDVGPEDRFSSHAPFHFDLSVLDLYLCAWCSATLVLVDDATGKQPRLLAPLIAKERLTVWYSTPSILALLVQGGQLERHDCSTLRYVLFAGEVFPVQHLRALAQEWPGAEYHNLYGPTETNVCTAYAVPTPVPEDRAEPYPIGLACPHVETSVRSEGGEVLDTAEEGELCVRGAPVMQGYWGRPERTAAAFFPAEDGGDAWYRTGDIVQEGDEGYLFMGRRDRMVKRRGNRVELGEVEARLHRHPDLVEAAVIATEDADASVRIHAFLCWSEGRKPSLVDLRRFCVENLPTAMIPDVFSHPEALPRTSTDKIDYQRLMELA